MNRALRVFHLVPVDRLILSLLEAVILTKVYRLPLATPIKAYPALQGILIKVCHRAQDDPIKAYRRLLPATRLILCLQGVE